MDSIVVYSPRSSPRLKYVLDWLIKERLQTSYILTHDEQEAMSARCCITYGSALPGCTNIPDAGLLWQTTIQPQELNTTLWENIPVLYPVDGADSDLPFDLLAALFFLLSRYEEYGDFVPDKHDRYPATASILYKKGWLQRPLADEWVCTFRKQLMAATGIILPEQHFLYQPTYDIDMAYAHLHKGLKRLLGALMRALLKGDVRQLSERTQVLKNKQKDPFDSFRWLRQLHREYGCTPLYFVLSAQKVTAYDKNIHPLHPAMMRVTKNLAKESTLGIHPSYYSDIGNLVSQEKKILERVAGQQITISRQHYIKIKTPDTYRLLLQNGIVHDYSMGYGAHLGYRASTSNSFLWYDIQQETVTTLRIHPFCFMDSTAHYELKLSAAEAFEKLEAMSKIAEQTGSTLITVFHNFSLGTSTEWKGWRQCYETFMQEKCRKQYEDIVV